MTSLKINFNTGACEVDWNAAVSGARLLVQKTAVGILTDEGSDKSLPARGNKLRRQVIGIGAYDLQGIQHSCNFAASKTNRDIQRYSDNTDPSEQPSSVSLKLTGLSGGVVSTSISVTSASGVRTGASLDI